MDFFKQNNRAALDSPTCCFFKYFFKVDANMNLPRRSNRNRRRKTQEKAEGVKEQQQQEKHGTERAKLQNDDLIIITWQQLQPAKIMPCYSGDVMSS